MEQFPSADHLASWAGMCSGNNESAGKRRSGRITKGDRWLKRILVQAAWAASHTKGTYLAAQYRRLAKRRGRKRALVAVGHTLLVIIYHVLKRGTTYAELGADLLDRLAPERLVRRLIKRLESLGHKVTLEPAPGGYIFRAAKRKLRESKAGPPRWARGGQTIYKPAALAQAMRRLAPTDGTGLPLLAVPAENDISSGPAGPLLMETATPTISKPRAAS
jgi:Transposase IS116/IS110/IS902 family